MYTSTKNLFRKTTETEVLNGDWNDKLEKTFLALLHEKEDFPEIR